MALFHILAHDREGALQTRLDNRAAHLDWAKSQGERVKLAGPIFAPDGETFIGSVFIVEAGNIEEVKAWQSHDPYVKASLFDRVEITPFKWVIGAPD